ncbi:Bcr/CflA family drug resistance efflux transporter, partial [Vibrio sp. 03_296]
MRVTLSSSNSTFKQTRRLRSNRESFSMFILNFPIRISAMNIHHFHSYHEAVKSLIKVLVQLECLLSGQSQSVNYNGVVNLACVVSPLAIDIYLPALPLISNTFSVEHA